MAARLSVKVLAARETPAVEAAVRNAALRWIPLTAEFLRAEGADVVVPETVGINVREGAGAAWTRGREITLYRRDTVHSTIAPLAHELVHVLAPRSAVPALDEGLAVHIDSQLALAGPVWPFYRLPPDRWVAGFVDDGTLLPVAPLLTSSRSPAADPVLWPVLHRFYLEAASLVGFLLQHDREAFWAWFTAGSPTGLVVPDPLQAAWLDQVGASLSPSERSLRDESIRKQTRTWHRIRREEDDRHSELEPSKRGAR